MLRKFEKIAFDVIFTTAYDQYAIEAFRNAALDYLLKPIDIEILQQAVEKVAKKAMVSELEYHWDKVLKGFKISIPSPMVSFLSTRKI